jgi:hypothetical protein
MNWTRLDEADMQTDGGNILCCRSFDCWQVEHKLAEVWWIVRSNVFFQFGDEAMQGLFHD